LSGASATRATFHQKLEQLKGASDAFHREGVEFLLMLLDPDAAHRMTAEGALHHAFLARDFESVPADAFPPKVRKDRGPLKTTFDRQLWDWCIQSVQNSEEEGVEEILPAAQGCSRVQGISAS
jgi:hypothetical protein